MKRLQLDHRGAATVVTDAALPSMRIDPSGLDVATPWGSLRFDATGLHVSSGGAAIHLAVPVAGISR